VGWPVPLRNENRIVHIISEGRIIIKRGHRHKDSLSQS